MNLLQTILTLGKHKPTSKEADANKIVAPAAPEVAKHSVLEPASDSTVTRSANYPPADFGQKPGTNTFICQRTRLVVGFGANGRPKIREIDAATGEVLASRPHEKPGRPRGSEEVLDRWRNR
jgi:hypothetical protein